MSKPMITLASLGPEHIDAGVSLSRKAGWPHRAEDWLMLLDLGCGIVALDQARVVGTAMLTPFGDDAATINMVIVDEAMRGQGLGRRLMQACLGIAGARECRLVATRDGLPLYQRLGFYATGTITQHQGTVMALKDAALRDIASTDDIAWCDAGQAAACAEMDRVAIGMDRFQLIERLFAQGRVAIRRRGGGIAGFIVLRDFGRGEVAGPLVAATLEDARALLRFILRDREGAFLRVDTPESAGLIPDLIAGNLLSVGGGIPMRRPAASDTATDPAGAFHTFALASQAVG